METVDEDNGDDDGFGGVLRKREQSGQRKDAGEKPKLKKKKDKDQKPVNEVRRAVLSQALCVVDALFGNLDQ